MAKYHFWYDVRILEGLTRSSQLSVDGTHAHLPNDPVVVIFQLHAEDNDLVYLHVIASSFGCLPMHFNHMDPSPQLECLDVALYSAASYPSILSLPSLESDDPHRLYDDLLLLIHQFPNIVTPPQRMKVKLPVASQSHPTWIKYCDDFPSSNLPSS